jgi:hypothetical protein
MQEAIMSSGETVGDGLCGETVCSQCDAPFECGIAAGRSRCWCFDLPVVAVYDSDAGCVCPRCLADRVATADRTRTHADGLRT